MGSAAPLTRVASGALSSISADPALHSARVASLQAVFRCGLKADDLYNCILYIIIKMT